MGSVIWGRELAEIYDIVYCNEQIALLAPMLDLLVEHAGNGSALEFAVGTGRVSLPLSERGVLVRGIELSPEMADRLRAKPGSAAVDVTVGDMRTTQLDETFPLVYLVANSIMNVTTQEDQIEVFTNAARHLQPSGCFVVEVIVPALRAVPPGEVGRIFTLDADHVGIETVRRSGRADRLVASMDGGGRTTRQARGAVPLRLALGVGADGEACRLTAPAPLGGLEPGPFHLREHTSGRGVREAGPKLKGRQQGRVARSGDGGKGPVSGNGRRS